MAGNLLYGFPVLIHITVSKIVAQRDRETQTNAATSWWDEGGGGGVREGEGEGRESELMMKEGGNVGAIQRGGEGGWDEGQWAGVYEEEEEGEEARENQKVGDGGMEKGRDGRIGEGRKVGCYMGSGVGWVGEVGR